MPNIVIPKRSPLRQHGGLWDAAYHLIHPDNDDAVNISEYVMRSGHQKYWGDPGNPQVIPGGGMADNQFRPTEFSRWLTRCQSGPEIWNPKCSPYPIAGADPFIDDPNLTIDATVVPPCPAPEPVSTVTEKHGNLEYMPSEISPMVMFSGWDKGNFNLQNPDMDPWIDTVTDLRRGRSCAVESLLLNGAGQVDFWGRPVFGQLAGANLSPTAYNPLGAPATTNVYEEGQPGIVTVLADGSPVAVEEGIQALEDALASCLCDDAGMIHVPPSVSDMICDWLYYDVQDYGDGHGPRRLNRTKARGNVVVAGGGYCEALGPYGCPPQPNSAWIYATPQVYLAWDNITMLPDRGDVEGGAWVYSNDTLIIAEQPVAAFFNDCCKFAIQVTIC